MAVLSHLRAIGELNHYISSSSSPQIRYALIACLLFVCFETFQGSYASSVQQTYGGLKILKSYYMGKPGSRPWIPRRNIGESANPARKAIEAAKVLQTREGCDNVSKERSMVQHVEEYLQTEIASDPDLDIESSMYDTEHLMMSPVYAVYNPRAKHVDIPNMTGSEFANDQASPKVLAIQSSSSQSTGSLTSHQSLPAQSSEALDSSGRISSSTSSLESTPTTYTPHSTGPHTPSPLPLPPTSGPPASRKRPLASRSPTPNPLQNDLPIEETLIQSFVKLDGQGLFFGMIPGIPPLIWDIHKTWHLPIPESFRDYPTAQRCWDFLMDRVLQFYRRTQFNKAYAPSTCDPPSVIEKQHNSYTQQLASFNRAFKPILDEAMDSDGKVLNAAALVISLYQRCTAIMLVTVQSDSEMLYDKYLADFQYVVRTCAILVACEDTLQVPRNRRFSFDTGIIPPLHVVATKCRDPIVRREAIDILFSSPRQEGMWDGVLSARIARWITSCEEEGLPPPPIPPDQNQAKNGPLGGENQSSYPSPPHIAEEAGGWQNGRRISEVVSEHIGRAIAEYGPASEGGKLLNSAGIRGHIPLRRSVEKEKSLEAERTKGWIVPEENRVQLMVVDFHIPDRHIRVKCQRVLLSKDRTRVERETVIAW